MLLVAAHGDAALVRVDDRLGDSEPEAAARDHPLGGGLGAEEPLEDPLLVGGPDADAGVRDAQHRIVSLDGQGDLDLPALRGELHGVGDEVAGELGHPRRVQGEVGDRGRDQGQLDVLARGLRPHLLHRLGGDARQVRVADLQRQLPRLHLGQEQQITHQVQEAFRVALDDPGEVVGVPPAGPLVPQQLDVADDRGQRRPQLVRDEGDKLVLQPVQLAQPLVLGAQFTGLAGQGVLGHDLGTDIPGDPERADDLAAFIAEGHLRRGHPGVRLAGIGLPLDPFHHRLPGADDLLLISERL